MSTVVDEAPAPSAELRTTLALASLSVALIGVMSAVHGGVAVVPMVGMAAVQVAVAAALSFTSVRWVLAPAAALDVSMALMWAVTRATGVQPIDVGGGIGAVTGLAIAGGAVALLRGADDRTCARWSRFAFVVFAGAAFTGFGHLGH